MTRYEKVADRAVAARLAEEAGEPVSLFTVSCVADAAARAAGRKSDLYPSLYAYAFLLPAGYTTRWLKAGGGSDSLLMVVREDWQPGSSQSRSLLLGRGPLVPACVD